MLAFFSRIIDILFFKPWTIRFYAVIMSAPLLLGVLYNLGQPATFNWFLLKKFIIWQPRLSWLLPLFTFYSLLLNLYMPTNLNITHSNFYVKRIQPRHEYTIQYEDLLGLYIFLKQHLPSLK